MSMGNSIMSMPISRPDNLSKGNILTVLESPQDSENGCVESLMKFVIIS